VGSILFRNVKIEPAEKGRSLESQNRIYEAGVGVKRKINELRFGRQADWLQAATRAFSSLVG